MAAPHRAEPDHMALSTMTQDYLKAIWSAEAAGRDGMSVNELARHVGVVASTASENVRRLADQGLVDHAPYRKARLTAAGRAVAVAMIRRHRILETYLHDALGFEWDEVHEEAEILEHAVSDRLLARLDAALGHPRRDPHGDPIPAADGSWIAPQTVSLTEMEEGERGRVARVRDRDPQAMRVLESAGIGLDVVVTVCSVDPSIDEAFSSAAESGTASCVVEVAGKCVTLDRSHAAAVFVERLP